MVIQLLCCVPNIGHWSVIVGLLQGRFDYADKGLLDRTHVSFFTPQTLREMLWDAGYIVVNEDAAMAGHPQISSILAEAGCRFGVSSEQVVEDVNTYQKVYVTKMKPDPFKDPEKMAILLGPHVGKLGPSSKRCSIVIVTYNSAKTIDECVGSVIPTMSPDDEVIVVDNASSDATVKNLEAYEEDSRVKVIANGENLGFSKGVNQGILQSAGEFIVSLNPDTKVWPTWLERMIARFDDPTVGAVGPMSDNVTGDQSVGRFLPSWTPQTDPGEVAWAVYNQPARMLETRLLMGLCLMLRRPVLDRSGCLDEECFLGADDLEISWRYQVLALRLVCATDVFVRHALGASFNSVSAEYKRHHVRVSDQALKSKLRRYYTCMPSSNDLWRNAIFQSALEE